MAYTSLRPHIPFSKCALLTGSRHIPVGISKADTENQAMRHAHGLAEVSSKVLIIDSGKDYDRVDHGVAHVRTDYKGISHDVVYDVYRVR